jgi:hypothetical protein
MKFLVKLSFRTETSFSVGWSTFTNLVVENGSVTKS